MDELLERIVGTLTQSTQRAQRKREKVKDRTD